MNRKSSKIKRNQIRLLALSEAGKENVEAAAKIQTLDNLEQVWVNKNDTKNIKNFNQDVCYIVDPFDDEIVPHIVGLGYPVIGPQCALTLAKHNLKLSSQMEYPVANMTMRGLIVCFSNVIKSKRAELSRLTKLMGGTITKELTISTTHLIIDEVGSVKYFKACEMGISTMKTEWIEYLWKNGQSKYICAKDAVWENFACPILAGCAICITGFQADQRKKIWNDVESNGGTYSGAMKINEVTHLICAKPEGQKYMYAKEYGAKVVDLSWLYDSLNKGWCQDSLKYPVKKSPSQEKKIKASSPKRFGSNAEIPDLNPNGAGNISSINMTHVNETVNATFEASCIQSKQHTFLQPNPVKTTSIMAALNSISGDLSTDVFDGISTFTVGFTAKETDKITKILSLNGATKYGFLTASVTHVIIGVLHTIPKDVRSAVKSAAEAGEVSVVKVDWVIKSLERNQIASETEHWVTEFAPCPMEFNETAENTRLELESEDTTMFKFDMENHQDEDLLSQYADTTFAYGATNENWMNGATFYLRGFGDEMRRFYADAILKNGGKMSDFYGADYNIAPMISEHENFISDFWLEKCLMEKNLNKVESHSMFSVISANVNVPFSNKNISMKGFDDLEVKFLTKIIDATGGKFCENVADADLVLCENKETNTGHKSYSVQQFIQKTTKVEEDLKPIFVKESREKMSHIKLGMHKRHLKKLEENQLAMKSKATPMSVRRKRHKNIMQSLEGIDSPGKIFQPGHKLKINFKLDEIFKHLETPEKQAKVVRKSLGSKENLNLNEFDLRDIFKYLDTPSSKQEEVKQKLASTNECDKEDIVTKINFDDSTMCEENETANKQSNVLQDTVILLSKKLSSGLAQNSNVLANELGATVLYNYDPSITHLVYEGKSSGQEYKQAKSGSKYIVSPHWLKACAEANSKIDERLYPNTFNPDKSIHCETRSQDFSSGESQKAHDDLKKTVENIISSTKNTGVEAVRRLSTKCTTPATGPKQNSTKSDLVSSVTKKSGLSQDVQIGWDDPTSRQEIERLKQVENEELIPENEDISDVAKNGTAPKFMFTGIAAKDKQEFIDIINSLEGEVIESNGFDLNCTHLVMQALDRREKFLSAISVGCWCLHTSYLKACQEAGCFVNEESFEYGSEALTEKLSAESSIKESTRQLMDVPRRWRLKLGNRSKSKEERSGAFEGWNVLMLLDNTYSQVFSRIIRNGCGEVAGMSLPHSGELSVITHAIVDSNSKEKCSKMPKNVNVCERQFIADFLIRDNNKRESDDQVDSKNPPKKLRHK